MILRDELASPTCDPPAEALKVVLPKTHWSATVGINAIDQSRIPIASSRWVSIAFDPVFLLAERTPEVLGMLLRIWCA